MIWHKIFFNSNSIRAEVDSACLIKMPNRSRYLGYSFWHPNKLVREQGGKGYHYTFSFHDEWVFKLKKYGAGKHNFRDVIAEMEIDASDMMDAFGVVNESVNLSVEQETDKINLKNLEETVVEHHVPESKDALISNEINELRK